MLFRSEWALARPEVRQMLWGDCLEPSAVWVLGPYVPKWPAGKERSRSSATVPHPPRDLLLRQQCASCTLAHTSPTRSRMPAAARVLRMRSDGPLPLSQQLALDA